jgi:hypothetical protein
MPMPYANEQQAEELHDPSGVIREPAHAESETRQLLRLLRRPTTEGQGMPESELWRVWRELSRRGEAEATTVFLHSLKNLHRRRALGAATLGLEDPDPGEHRLIEDPYVGELWKAYKRCISGGRTGPAAQLLRDLEVQLEG